MTAAPAPAQPYDHAKRVQRYAYVTFALAAGAAAFIASRSTDVVLGAALPRGLDLGLAALGLLAGVLATSRRSTPIAAAAAGILVLAVVPGALVHPGWPDYALGLAFGVLALAALELVHMTVRYERAHRAVETEGVPEEHINRVTDEALKTLAQRGGLALAGAAAAVGGAYLLAAVGPLAWRESLETTAPLGVALAGLVLALVAALVILVRGSAIRRSDESTSTEIAPDAIE